MLVVLCLATAAAACSEEVEPSVDKPPTTATTPADSGRPLELPGEAGMLLRPGNPPGAPPEQLGSAALTTGVVSEEGGRVATGTDPNGDSAFTFPAFQPVGPYPRAAVVAKPDGDPAVLDPGNRRFQWGADLKIDPKSVGRTIDNGNNVLQRGLSVDADMFKLEVDANMRPSCSVKGADGEVVVYASEAVSPGTWYRIRCARRAHRLTIYVGEFLPSGATTATGRAKVGSVGTVNFADPLTPVSVGGKVANNGQIVKDATDQFNGSISNPFILVRAG